MEIDANVGRPSNSIGSPVEKVNMGEGEWWSWLKRLVLTFSGWPTGRGPARWFLAKRLRRDGMDHGHVSAKFPYVAARRSAARERVSV